MKLLGKKLGMTRRFDKTGNSVVCTAIEVLPSTVVYIKTKERDGYSAAQMGFDAMVAKDRRTIQNRIGKPLMGHYAKHNVAPCRYLFEIKDPEELSNGQSLSVEVLQDVSKVDVAGTSKGKGFQGVIKRHGFRGGPASHGASRFHRLGGSVGMRSTPGRSLPGGKKAGRMGGSRVTARQLKVVDVDVQNNILFVYGSVPGANKGVVEIMYTPKRSEK